MGNTSEGGGVARKRGCGWTKEDFLPEESFQSWGTYMKKTLNWWDLLWFGIGAVMGSGIFVLTGEAANEYAGPAVVLSYFISGVSAILSVLCYTEFAVELPVAGGSFAYLRVELGDFVAYVAAGNILFELQPFRPYCSLTKADSANFKDFAPFGLRGILKASSMLFFAYVGFDGTTTLGEEIKKPARDIPIGLIGSMSLVMIVYCLLAATLVLMQPYAQIDVDAPYSVAFSAVGMDWAKYIVAFGALKGMTTVLLANIIGQARYFTHIGRTHMAPPFLATINKKTGTPVNATVFMTIANSVIAFFTSLDVLANLLSISTLFIFSLVALALLVRRYYQGRKPKIWGAPIVPWLPSASIAINVFILGSMDGSSFARFAVWTGILLVYYLFVGLHASYDAAKVAQKEVQVSQATSMEAGIAS
ncbi:unnamed protein product, partial [Vitis vinifera]